MANATLQSFNVFLTERLTAAAVDIFGFVEKTIIDYQDEVYRAKLENERLQRLLDLVYKPEIKLHRADSRQIDLPTPTQEVCAQEQQIQKECIPTEVKKEPLVFKEELIEPWAGPVETPACPAHSSVSDAPTQTQTVRDGEHEENKTPDTPTQVMTVGEHSTHGALDSQTRFVTLGEHMGYETASQYDQPLPSSGVSPLFFCNICHVPFQSEVELKSHLASHKAKKPLKSTHKEFTCLFCNRITGSRRQMICHVRAHTGEKPYGCPVCGNRYTLKGHLKEHLRTHTGERPYTCRICGKGFNRSSTMNRHAKTKHSENMPFKCAHCSQGFPLFLTLKRHMTRVHGITFSA